MAQDCVFDLLFLDDSHFSSLFHEDDEELEEDHVPISDDKYAQYLQSQETLIASFITSQMERNNSSSSILLLPSSSSSSSSLIGSETCSASKIEQVKSSIGTGESSQSQVICEICAETKGCNLMFTNQRCLHSFCSDCVTKQVAIKIQDSISVVPCPGFDCKGVLELEVCRPILPKELLERWELALCESLFLEAPKFYCPFKDCSAMLLVEDEDDEDRRESECPFCHRLFCARCHVPWHPGVECEEFQRLNENEREREDLLVRELANEKKWRRCPQCKFYVEKVYGCLHITCRCQYEFCYDCGDEWTSTHGGCQRN